MVYEGQLQCGLLFKQNIGGDPPQPSENYNVK